MVLPLMKSVERVRDSALIRMGAVLCSTSSAWEFVATCATVGCLFEGSSRLGYGHLYWG